MRRSFKKTIGMFLCAVFMASCTIVSLAAPKQDVSIGDLCSQYNLQKVESIPAGVVPTPCKNVDELKAIIESDNKAIHSKPVVSQAVQNVSASSDDYYNTLTLLDSYVTDVNTVYLKGTCLVHHFPTSPYTEFVSVDASTYLSGASLGYEWEQGSCTTYISPNKQYASASAHGTLKHYLIINGGILLWSKPVDLFASFQF